MLGTNKIVFGDHENSISNRLIIKTVFFFVIVFNWNHFETRLLNLRINFYLLRTFCPHLGSFCVVSSFTTFQPNFTSGLLQVILPRPRMGMLSLVTVSPVITAFHSCCLWPSKPLAGLGRIWNRYLLTMLTWNRRDSTPLSAAPRSPKGDQGWIFWSYKSLSGLPESSNPTQAGQRFTWSKTWCDRQQLWKAVITGDTVTRLSIPIRGRGKITWRRPEVKFGQNLVKEETTQKLPTWGQKVLNK